MKVKRAAASVAMGFLMATAGVACGDDEGVPPDVQDENNGGGTNGGGTETFPPEPEGTADEGVPPDEPDDGEDSG